MNQEPIPRIGHKVPKEVSHQIIVMSDQKMLNNLAQLQGLFTEIFVRCYSKLHRSSTLHFHSNINKTIACVFSRGLKTTQL